MQYMLLIYLDEKVWAGRPEAERKAVFGEYFALTEDLKKRDVWRGGAPLQPTDAATTVRVRDGRAMTTHGPFAETREQLGGFYLIEAKNLDEATAIAARIPSARMGSIEVRPILEVG